MDRCLLFVGDGTFVNMNAVCGVEIHVPLDSRDQRIIFRLAGANKPVYVWRTEVSLEVWQNALRVIKSLEIGM